jgi:hypothetical protein
MMELMEQKSGASGKPEFWVGCSTASSIQPKILDDSGAQFAISSVLRLICYLSGDFVRKSGRCSASLGKQYPRQFSGKVAKAD